jgi:hypothetical protein
MGQTVNLLSYDFTGSNPVLPTYYPVAARGVAGGEENQEAGVAQLVEHQPSKLRVAGSSLVSRSSFFAG